MLQLKLKTVHFSLLEDIRTADLQSQNGSQNDPRGVFREGQYNKGLPTEA